MCWQAVLMEDVLAVKHNYVAGKAQIPDHDVLMTGLARLAPCTAKEEEYRCLVPMQINNSTADWN